MELAAVVVVPDKELVVMPHECQTDMSGNDGSRSHVFPLRPILGNDVLQTWSARIQKLGIRRIWLAPDAHDESRICSILDTFVDQSFERLLMIKLKSYAEMDLADLLRFHCQARNSVTEAHDSRGHLGICMLDRAVLHEARDTPAPFVLPAPGQRRKYPFHGYAKRILSPRERQELVGDALTGGCAMRPLGREIREQVWIGQDVSLASSVRVIGPTYIGDRTVIAAGATIGPFASVECDCVIDSGCTVERSTLLPSTYLAPGLLIRDALVDGGSLQHVRCGAVADLRSAGLARRIRPSQPQPRGSDEDTADFASPTDGHWKSSVQSSAQWREMQI